MKLPAGAAVAGAPPPPFQPGPLLRDLLIGLKESYGDVLPPLMVTENGVAFPDEVVDGRVDDPRRVEYLRSHMAAVGEAADAGVDVRGFFVWSFLDNFEWAEGYRPHFGLYRVSRPDFTRTATEGATVLGAIAGARALTTAQRQQYGGDGPMTPEPGVPAQVDLCGSLYPP